MDHPEFFKPALPITVADDARLGAVSGSWVKFHPVLRKLNEIDCLKAAAIELRERARPLIVYRCIGRFRTLRTIRENKELRRA